MTQFTLSASKSDGGLATPASWLVQDGVPLYDVQALLGHEDYAATQAVRSPCSRRTRKVRESWARRSDAPVTHDAKEGRSS
jgi:integrase